MPSRPFVSGKTTRTLPTRRLNEAINFAEQADRFGNRAVTIPRQPQFAVSILNESGADWDQWAAVGLGDHLLDPDYNEQDFRQRIGFVGETPDHDDHLDMFAVLTKPIHDGQIGKALLTGMLNCKVDVIHAEHNYVRPKDGTAELETCGAGGGRILKPRPFTDIGEQWATVSLEPYGGTGFAYLTAYMATATVTGTPTILTPGTASADVWTFDSNGVWANTEDEIEIQNPWEQVSGNTNSLISFVMHNGRWMLTGMSCDPSQLVAIP